MFYLLDLKIYILMGTWYCEAATLFCSFASSADRKWVPKRKLRHVGLILWDRIVKLSTNNEDSLTCLLEYWRVRIIWCIIIKMPAARWWYYNVEHKKSRIRETSNLSTDADRRTDTILERLHDLSKKNPEYGRHHLTWPMRIVGPIQFCRGCVIYLNFYLFW